MNTTEMVIIIQKLLVKMGNVLKVDGIIGPKTEAVIREVIGEDGDSGIAWSGKLTKPFLDAVVDMSARLGVNPSYITTIMALETGRRFTSDVTNAAGSGATGLIQFMPSTAKGLGTTTAQLAKMTPIEQLVYVEKYFEPYIGKMDRLVDCYFAVLYPAAMGGAMDEVVWSRTSSTAFLRKCYTQNIGFDKAKKGFITVRDVADTIQKVMDEGMTKTA